MLGRLDYEIQRNLAWAEVSASDFQETECKSDDLFEISQELHDMLPQLNASIILWQEEPNETMVLAQSPRLDILTRLNLEFSGSLKNHQAILKIIGSDTFSARTKIEGLINPLL